MKKVMVTILGLTLMLASGATLAKSKVKVSGLTGSKNLVNGLSVDNNLMKKGKNCLECHADHNPGIVGDWRGSRHSHSGVSCIDCHSLPKDNPMAAQNCEGVKGTDTYVSMMVAPSKCAECHPGEYKQFSESGHYRARKQYIPKKGLHKLVFQHEGQQHPTLKHAGHVTGCIQCHGEIIKMDKNRRPDAKTWPNSGIGTIWPDGSVGNCTVCHTRHKFSIEEARKPEACASCHLGPDHPQIEIFNSSKHGQIYKTEGHTWKFDDPAGAWEPGVSYRGPTCATCHMSGVGKLETTHNVSKRLYWNLWAKMSKPRNSTDPMSPLTGHAKKGRAEMEYVCSLCHGSTMTKNFFTQGDDAVKLYNEAYWKPAEKMRKELKAKNLLKDNPWDDEFQKTHYYLWHHQGRRARMAAMMGSADYAHWHGFFELQQDLYKLKSIYKKRMKSGKIE